MAHSFQHFTGKRKKQERQRKSTRKQRNMRRGSHVNKYANG